MADKLSRQPQNLPGPWYVDTTCALCRLCLEEAPNLLNYTSDETAVYFSKQPETPEDMAASLIAALAVRSLRRIRAISNSI